jgi:hypothetical protein
MSFQKKKYSKKLASKQNQEEDDKIMTLKPTLAINKNINTFDYAEPSYLDEVVFDFR